MAKIKRFSGSWNEDNVNEEISFDMATVSALAGALTGGAITWAVISDVSKWMKDHNYTGVKGFIRALKEWRESKKGDDVASKF